MVCDIADFLSLSLIVFIAENLILTISVTIIITQNTYLVVIICIGDPK